MGGGILKKNFMVGNGEGPMGKKETQKIGREQKVTQEHAPEFPA